MKTLRWGAVMPGLLGVLAVFLSIFGASAPSLAQRNLKPSLRGAQIPFRLPSGRIARPSGHGAFRYLDSIRVRFHDEAHAPNRPAKAANDGTQNLQKTRAVDTKEVPAEPVTQILSEAELMRRGVPTLKRTVSQPKLGIQVYQLDDPAKRDEALAALRKMPEVRYAEPVQRIQLLTLPPPNDAFYALDDTTTPKLDESHIWRYQWTLPLIHAYEAWGVYPNKYYTAAQKKLTPGPKIAVIDTGIDYLHPDFVNTGGVAANGTEASDVINGGQLDLTDGYDFYYDIADPLDDYGHGTHVSGIAAAATNNGAGVAAIGYPSQIMPLKVTDPSGDGDDIDVINALIWAADHGAVVANLSLALNGGYSQGLQDAVDYCWSKNLLVVAAAGNDGVDYVRRYPAACNKVLAVAATGYADDSGNAYPEAPASYTDSGLYVGIAAPGGDLSAWFTGDLIIPGLPSELTFVYSTVPTYPVPAIPDLDYAYEEGTSMASPHGAGLAILYAASKGYTQTTANGPQKIVKAIQRGADNFIGRVDGGWHPSGGYGRINALATLTDTFGADRNFSNASPNTPGGVTGQATYYGTALLNARVDLTAAGRKKYTANTKDDGTYRLPNVPAGNYVATCKWQNITQTANIVVTAGCDTMATDFALDAGSTVAVTINPHSATVNWGGNYTFAATVSGSSNQSVAWSLVSGPGSLNATTGKYTAPASGANATTAVIKAVSAADATKSDTATVYLPPTPKTLTFSPNPVVGGSGSTATLTLTGAAPAGGASVALTSANTSVVTVPATVTVAAGATSATFTATTSSVSANTTVNVTAAYGGASLTSALTVNAPVTTIRRVNCGGPAYNATSNRAFVADAYFTGGAPTTRSNTITGTSDPALYQTLRYAPNFSYSVTVPNGTYTVKLHFAETSSVYFAVGKRKSNVTINGTLTYSNLDVFAEAGAGNAALVKTSTVTVTNGKVDIILTNVVGTNAFINAIEIY